jgi:hypothetical protein
MVAPGSQQSLIPKVRRKRYDLVLVMINTPLVHEPPDAILLRLLNTEELLAYEHARCGDCHARISVLHRVLAREYREVLHAG